MKTVKILIIVLSLLSFIFLGFASIMYYAIGIEPSVENSLISESTAEWMGLSALLGYCIAAGTMVYFFAFSRWWVSYKEMDAMTQKAQNKKIMYESAVKELEKAVGNLFWKDYIPIKALRDTRTKEWLVWDGDVEVWATTGLPQPMPETATMEGLKELEDLKLASVPDHSEMVEGVIIIKK